MPTPRLELEPEVIDPVCGMSILRLDAVGHLEHRGQTYHFCSRELPGEIPRRAGGPSKTTEAPPPARRRAGDTREYTCPMDPEVRQVGPGACPKCGMALEPVPPRR